MQSETVFPNDSKIYASKQNLRLPSHMDMQGLIYRVLKMINQRKSDIGWQDWADELIRISVGLDRTVTFSKGYGNKIPDSRSLCTNHLGKDHLQINYCFIFRCTLMYFSVAWHIFKTKTFTYVLSAHTPKNKK